MDHDALIEAIQLAYPQLWFACHVEHRTRRHGRLTDREARSEAASTREP
ncbi:MAG: hypothetical protein KA391_05830 [Luteimonas sp.]|nr:hypothetical protein [Luteimonas sp.]